MFCQETLSKKKKKATKLAQNKNTTPTMKNYLKNDKAATLIVKLEICIMSARPNYNVVKTPFYSQQQQNVNRHKTRHKQAS